MSSATIPGVASPNGRGSTASPAPLAHKCACTSRLLLRNPTSAFGSAEHGIAFVGEDEAASGALEKRVTDRRLQRAQPAAHGRLGLAELPRGGTEGALARDGQEDAQIAPFQSAAPRLRCPNGIA